MIRVAVVDDNKKYIKDMESLIYRHMKENEYILKKYSDEIQFIDDINSGTIFDVVFLDIILNKLNGIDIGYMITQRFPSVIIVFVSANSEFFKDVYNVDHAYFLIKPFEPDRFEKAMIKVLEKINSAFLVLHLKTGTKKIELNNVLFYENFLRHTKIHFTGGVIEEYPIKLSEIEEVLPKKHFIRTHQSFIVNLDKHIAAERFAIYFPNNLSVPISKKYLNEVKDKISLYLGGAL